ncbi:helix-turn-helix domain-containing protein [Carnobacterium jeotgali]|nr:helix-turn-helix transcriptional regulator [Carnobacterium jeotgali]
MSKWENDISYPELDNLVKLSTYYQVSIDHLLKEKP